jgi:hypothetical protein
MNTQKEYKNKIRKLFFISVNKDINIWTNGDKRLYSPTYNNFYMVIRTDYSQLKIYGNNDSCKICKYRFLSMPIDIKVWWYVRKIKKHFKQVEIDKQHEEEIKFLKSGLTDIQEKFIKEIRKEKLTEINKS